MFPLYRIIRACNPWVNRCIAKLDGVGPGHILHREIVRSLEIARGLPHHRMVLALRHLMNAKAERLGDPYPMLGLLIGTRFSIGFRRAHEEFPRLDADELHADRVGDKLRGRGGRRWGHRRLRAGRVGGKLLGRGGRRWGHRRLRAVRGCQPPAELGQHNDDDDHARHRHQSPRRTGWESDGARKRNGRGAMPCGSGLYGRQG